MIVRYLKPGLPAERSLARSRHRAPDRDRGAAGSRRGRDDHQARQAHDPETNAVINSKTGRGERPSSRPTPIECNKTRRRQTESDEYVEKARTHHLIQPILHPNEPLEGSSTKKIHRWTYLIFFARLQYCQAIPPVSTPGRSSGTQQAPYCGRAWCAVPTDIIFTSGLAASLTGSIG